MSLQFLDQHKSAPTGRSKRVRCTRARRRPLAGRAGVQRARALYDGLERDEVKEDTAGDRFGQPAHSALSPGGEQVVLVCFQGPSY